MSLSLPIRSTSSSVFEDVAKSSMQTLASSTDTQRYDKILASWSRAVELFNEQLTKDEKKKIDLSSLKGGFSELRQSAASIRDKVENARYPWTPTLRKIIDQINRYAVVGDVIIQHHTEYMSLVWGTVRFLLLFAAEESKVSEKISEGLHIVTQSVFRAEEYAKLFSTPADSSTDRVFESLHENLNYLYAECLSFLVRSTVFFKKHSLRLSSDTKFRTILDKVRDYERRVEQNKDLLESEARKKQEQYENGIWLQAADFTTELKRRKDDHLPDTCVWFFERKEYTSFKEASNESQISFLWVSGKPGCGKSILAAQITKNLIDLGCTVVFVFCKAGLERRNTLHAILRNILFQLLNGEGEHPHRHRMLLSLRQMEQKDPAECTDGLWELLIRILKDGDSLFFVLDGIDECDCSNFERQAFISRLTDAFRLNNPKARIVCLSQLTISDLDPVKQFWTVMSIQAGDLQADISRISEFKLSNSKVLSAHSKKNELLDVMIANSDGMILWVHFMVHELELGRWNYKEVLKQPPRGLRPLYESILRRIFINSNTADRNQRAISTVLVAMRPLRLEELALIIAVSEGLQSHDEYNACGDPIDEAKQIVDECSPLLAVLPDDTIQIAHSSLREILFAEPSLEIQGYTFLVENANLRMASTLIKYLSLELLIEIKETQASLCLLEYASVFLIDHCVQSVEVLPQLVEFFESDVGWKWVRRLIEEYGHSIEKLQVLQSRLSAKLVPVSSETSEKLRNFLLSTARRRLNNLESLPMDDMARVTAMNQLADIYHHQGLWKEASELQEHVVKTRQRLLGNDHPDTLGSMSSLVFTYLDLGQLKEAEELQENITETRRQLLGDDHNDTLFSVSSLASVYSAQGRIREAEKLKKEVMEGWQRLLGNDHIFVLISMLNLAANYGSQERWKEAEDLQKPVTEILQQRLGDDSPQTLMSMSNLASTYLGQRRWQEAEELHRQVLETRQLVLGNDHAYTLSSMSKLASAYSEQGRWREAGELHGRVLELRQRVLGPTHTDTLASMDNLFEVYWKQEQWKEADELEERTMEIRQRLLEVNYPHLGSDTLDGTDNMNRLTGMYVRQEKWKEAEKLGKQVVEARQRLLGNDHSYTLTSANNLAVVYHRLGQLNKAVELLEDVIKKRQRALTLDHPDMLTSMNNLAYVYYGLDRREDAMDLMKEVVSKRSRVLGAEHEHTIISQQSLTEWLDQERDESGKEKLSQDAVTHNEVE